MPITTTTAINELTDKQGAAKRGRSMYDLPLGQQTANTLLESNYE